VVVVGGGASGLLTARALLRVGVRAVVLVERDATWSAGPAYATRDPQHLLNVRASALGVDSTEPRGFVAWAAEQLEDVHGDSFLPRVLYGDYLRESLHSVARADGRRSLTTVTGEVTAIDALRHGQRDSAIRIRLRDGRELLAAHAVLALGNPPPR